MKDYKCIYNLRLAGFLMMNGFPIQRIETNLGRPWRNVYLFEDNKKIEEMIKIYKEQKSNGGNIHVNIKNSTYKDG